MKAPSFITASEVVDRFRLSYQTLNYYTNLGLLRVAKRDGNQRLYDEQDVQRNLDAIGRLKDEGYPLRLISRMLTDGMRPLAVRLAPQR
jgi:DNA-binding transcriptional MerR regulator